MLTTAGPQQCLQSHLHEGLEVIASLPSAVLLGEDGHVTSVEALSGVMKPQHVKEVRM